VKNPERISFPTTAKKPLLRVTEKNQVITQAFAVSGILSFTVHLKISVKIFSM